MSSKIAKLTPMVRFPNRTGSVTEDLKSDNFLKLNDSVPNTDSQQQAPIIALVNQILAAKVSDSNAGTAALEKEIDKRVYALYNLTEEEIVIVEASE